MVDNADPARASRRRILATGGKLAYAAPLVAASYTLNAQKAGAQEVVSPGGVGGTGQCLHSAGPFFNNGVKVADEGGCMQACKTACNGGGGSACSRICGVCKNPPGDGNPCPDDSYCEATSYQCVNGSQVYSPAA
jgi:hypothetical protein